jgi:hypothetical protein
MGDVAYGQFGWADHCLMHLQGPEITGMACVVHYAESLLYYLCNLSILQSFLLRHRHPADLQLTHPFGAAVACCVAAGGAATA